MTKVSVQMVTWNSEHVIGAFLDSLKTQTFPDWTLTVVDNASSDGTIARIRSALPAATVIRNAANLGFAHAHNQALRFTKSPYVLVANADVLLDAKYLETCFSVMEKHRRIAAVQGKLLRMPAHDVLDAPGAIVGRASVLDSTGIARRKTGEFYDRGAGESDRGQYDGDEKILGTTGALSLYRRVAFETVAYAQSEYFDELFQSYKEDVDLALRLEKQGWLSVYVPTARAVHIRSAAAQKNTRVSERRTARALRSPQERYYSYRNHVYILIKHLDLKETIAHGAWIAVYELKKIGYALLFERPLLAAWIDVVGAVPKLIRKRREQKRRITPDQL